MRTTKRREITGWVNEGTISLSEAGDPRHCMCWLLCNTVYPYERACSVNPCNLRKGISKYKIKHKSLFFKRFNF